MQTELIQSVLHKQTYSTTNVHRIPESNALCVQTANRFCITEQNAVYAFRKITVIAGVMKPVLQTVPTKSHLDEPPFIIAVVTIIFVLDRSCATAGCTEDAPGPNPHELFGALVGGPGPNDEFEDLRTDRLKNRVSITYNAGFQSAVAGTCNGCYAS